MNSLRLHLNDYKAFERVLPSKLFEYGATNLPMLAGVNGYARKFVEENISNSYVFDPCDSASLINWLQSYSYQVEERKEFVENFQRRNICKLQVRSLLSYLEPITDLPGTRVRHVVNNIKPGTTKASWPIKVLKYRWI
jgi:hypothetical protein